jgi:hypothetical protein
MNLAEQETATAEPETAALADTAAPVVGETETADNAQEVAGEGEDTGPLVVSIGEDAPPQPDEPAPAWVRDLRKQNRELTKRLKELEASRQQQQPETALPAKPTLEACNYDEEAFADATLKWAEAKRKADDAKAAAQKQQEAAQAAWDAKLATYQERKQALPADDVDDAESAFMEALTAKWGEEGGKYRWALPVDGADNPAMLVYALGKNPGRAKQLAEIESLAKFAFTAAKMEGEVKVTKRTPAAPPEKQMTGTASVGVGGASEATLKRLREEADRTGDRSKVVAYLSQQRKQQRG